MIGREVAGLAPAFPLELTDGAGKVDAEPTDGVARKMPRFQIFSCRPMVVIPDGAADPGPMPRGLRNRLGAESIP